MASVRPNVKAQLLAAGHEETRLCSLEENPQHIWPCRLQCALGFMNGTNGNHDYAAIMMILILGLLLLLLLPLLLRLNTAC